MSSICMFVLLVLLSAAAARSSSRESSSEHRRLFQDLNPRSPRVEFESDGGRLETWGGSGSGAFEDANVAACRAVLRRRGLWLPSYVDTPSLHVVTRGAGRVGIVTPSTDRHVQENTFKVVKGDAVAVPEGHVVWWYNDQDEDMDIVGVAEATRSSRPAGLRTFHLAGARSDEVEESEEEQAGYGGIIHGFSKRVLAQAWEMDKSTLEELLEAQNGAGIIRLDEDITFRDHLEGQDNLFYQNFIYRFNKVHPDLRAEDGGELWELSSYKLPILKKLGLSLECMHLEQGAMVAPNWFHNAHQVLYVVSGRGRIEAVYNNGEKALDTDVEEGSMVVIPAFFPSTKVASGDEKFHYITFVTTHKPVVSYVSGRLSVFRGIPLKVLSRMLNVDEDQARRVQRAHEKESVIFASEGGRREYM